MTRRGRRIRADAGERGHGRAYVGDDVVVAVLVANREVRFILPPARNGKVRYIGYIRDP
jgi:hypothetical protein